MKNKVSIYDIAKYSEVSPAAVSYVINGVNKVSEETRKKVLKAINDLGYVPNHNARTLSTGKSHLIGLFLPLSDTSIAFLQNPFYAEFIGGLEKGIMNADYDIVIGSLKNEHDFERWIRSRNLDAVVMLGKYPKSVYDDIKKLNIPIVLTDVYEEYSNEFHNIRIDDEKGMYLATKHLIDKGHKDIGFIGFKEISLVDKKRYLGYKKAMEENKIEVKEEFLFTSFATFDDGYKIADEIINRNSVTAVACSADIIAIGIIKKYNELGKKVPDDLSIVGFDDIRDAEYIYPGLTTIHQDIGLKGEKAMEIILDTLKTNHNKKIIINLEPSLVIRDSVKEVNKS